MVKSKLTSFRCKTLFGIYKCNISVSHFANAKSGNYYLYYTKKEKYFDLSPIKVIIPKSILEIPIKYLYLRDIYIQDNGFLDFKTNYNDCENNIFDPFDIEEKTSFVTTLYNYYDTKIYNDINCRLWKPLNKNMWLFCKLNGSLNETDHIKINNAVFHYKEYIIAIVFYSSFYIETLNTSIPFLYSDRQIINIKEEIDSYDLKFHIGLYNEQPLSYPYILEK